MIYSMIVWYSETLLYGLHHLSNTARLVSTGHPVARGNENFKQGARTGA